MKHTAKRALSLLLALIMVVGMLPTSAMAASGTQADPHVFEIKDTGTSEGALLVSLMGWFGTTTYQYRVAGSNGSWGNIGTGNVPSKDGVLYEAQKLGWGWKHAGYFKTKMYYEIVLDLGTPPAGGGITIGGSTYTANPENPIKRYMTDSALQITGVNEVSGCTYKLYFTPDGGVKTEISQDDPLPKQSGTLSLQYMVPANVSVSVSGKGSATVTVDGNPANENGIITVDASDSTAELKVVPQTQTVSGNTATGYYIDKLTVNGTDVDDASISYNNATGTYTLQGIEPGGSYTVAVTLAERTIITASNGTIDYNFYYDADESLDKIKAELLSKIVTATTGGTLTASKLKVYVYNNTLNSWSEIGNSLLDNESFNDAVEDLRLVWAAEGKYPEVKAEVRVNVRESRGKAPISYDGHTFEVDSLDEVTADAVKSHVTAGSDGKATGEVTVSAPSGTFPDIEGQTANLTYTVTVADNENYVKTTGTITVPVKNKAHYTTLTFADTADYTISVKQGETAINSGAAVVSGDYTVTVTPKLEKGYINAVSVSGTAGSLGTPTWANGVLTATLTVTNDEGTATALTIGAESGIRSLVLKSGAQHVVNFKPGKAWADQSTTILDTLRGMIDAEASLATAADLIFRYHGGELSQITALGTYEIQVSLPATDKLPAVETSLNVEFKEGRTTPEITVGAVEQQTVTGDLNVIKAAVEAKMQALPTGVTYTMTVTGSVPKQGETGTATVTITTAANEDYLSATTTIQVPVIGAVKQANVKVVFNGGGTVTVEGKENYASGTVFEMNSDELTITAVPQDKWFVDTVKLGTGIVNATQATRDFTYNLPVSDGTGLAWDAAAPEYVVEVTFKERTLALKQNVEVKINGYSKDTIKAGYKAMLSQPDNFVDFNAYLGDLSVKRSDFTMKMWSTSKYYTFDELDNVIGDLVNVFDAPPYSKTVQVTWKGTGKYPTVLKDGISVSIVESRGQVQNIACSVSALTVDTVEEVKTAVLAGMTYDNKNGIASTPTAELISGTFPKQEGTSADLTYKITYAANENYLATTQNVTVNVTNKAYGTAVTYADTDDYTITVANVSTGTAVSTGDYTVTVAPKEDNGYITGLTFSGDSVAVVKSTSWNNCVLTAVVTITNDPGKSTAVEIQAETGVREIKLTSSNTVKYNGNQSWDAQKSAVEEKILTTIVDRAASGITDSDTVTAAVQDPGLGVKNVTVTWVGNAQYPTVSLTFQVEFNEDRETPALTIADIEPMTVTDSLQLVVDAVRSAITITPNTLVVNCTLAEGMTLPKQGETKMITVNVVTVATDDYVSVSTTKTVQVTGAVKPAEITVTFNGGGTVTVNGKNVANGETVTMNKGDLTLSVAPSGSFYVDTVEIDGEVVNGSQNTVNFETSKAIQDGTGSEHDAEAPEHTIEVTFADRTFTAPDVTVEMNGYQESRLNAAVFENLKSDILTKAGLIGQGSSYTADQFVVVLDTRLGDVNLDDVGLLGYGTLFTVVSVPEQGRKATITMKKSGKLPEISTTITMNIAESRPSSTISFTDPGLIEFDSADEVLNKVKACVTASHSFTVSAKTAPATNKDGQEQYPVYTISVTDSETVKGTSKDVTVTVKGKVHPAAIQIVEKGGTGTVILTAGGNAVSGTATSGTLKLDVTQPAGNGWYVESVTVQKNSGEPATLTDTANDYGFKSSFAVENGDAGAENTYVVTVQYVQRQILINNGIEVKYNAATDSTGENWNNFLNRVYEAAVSGSVPAASIEAKDCTVEFLGETIDTAEGAQNRFRITWAGTQQIPAVSAEFDVAVTENRTRVNIDTSKMTTDTVTLQGIVDAEKILAAIHGVVVPDDASAPVYTVDPNAMAPYQGKTGTVKVTISVAENANYTANSKEIEVPVVGDVKKAKVYVITTGTGAASINGTAMTNPDQFVEVNTGKVILKAEPAGSWYVDRINGSLVSGNTYAQTVELDVKDGTGSPWSAEAPVYTYTVEFAQRTIGLKEAPYVVAMDKGKTVIEQKDALEAAIRSAIVAEMPKGATSISSGEVKVWVEGFEVGSLGNLGKGWYTLTAGDAYFNDSTEKVQITYPAIGKYPAVSVEVTIQVVDSRPTVQFDDTAVVRIENVNTIEDIENGLSGKVVGYYEVDGKRTNVPVTINVPAANVNLSASMDGKVQTVTYTVSAEGGTGYVGSSKTFQVEVVGQVHNSRIILQQSEGGTIAVNCSDPENVLPGLYEVTVTPNEAEGWYVDQVLLNGEPKAVTYTNRVAKMTVTAFNLDSKPNEFKISVVYGQRKLELTDSISIRYNTDLDTQGSVTKNLLNTLIPASNGKESEYTVIGNIAPLAEADITITWNATEKYPAVSDTVRVTFTDKRSSANFIPGAITEQEIDGAVIKTKEDLLTVLETYVKGLENQVNPTSAEVTFTLKDGSEIPASGKQSEVTLLVTITPTENDLENWIANTVELIVPVRGKIYDAQVKVDQTGEDLSGAAVIIQNNATSERVAFGSDKTEHTFAGGKYTIIVAPTEGHYVDTVIVDGKTLTTGGVYEEGMFQNGVFTYDELELVYAKQHEIQVIYKPEKFVLQEDNRMHFRYGKDTPSDEAVYDAVILEPADWSAAKVQAIKYLAREAGTTVEVKLSEELTSLVGQYLDTTFHVALPEQWLTLNEQIEEVDVDAVVNAKVEEYLRNLLSGLPLAADAGDSLSDILGGLGGNLGDVLGGVNGGIDGIKDTIKTELGAILAPELKYYGCRAFGYGTDSDADVEETLYIVYEDAQKSISDNTIKIRLVDTRQKSTMTAGNAAPAVTYKGYTEAQLIDLIKPVVKDESGASITGLSTDLFDIEGKVEGLDVGAYEITVVFKGNDAYKNCAMTVSVTVNKADCTVDVPSQIVDYLPDPTYSIDPVTAPEANIKNIRFVVGIDGNNLANEEGSGAKIAGIAYVDLGDLFGSLGDVAYKAVVAALQLAGIDLEKEISLQTLINGLGGLLNNDIVTDLVGGAAGLDENTIQILENLLGSLNNLENLPDLRIKLVLNGDIRPKDVGVYVVGAVTADKNYNTAFGVGYLVIKPDGSRVEMDWNLKDDNHILTMESLLDEENPYDMGAHVLVSSTVDEEAAEVASSKIRYLFLGVDINGNIFLEEEVVKEIGAYTQLAYLADWGNTMYYAVPIVRAYVVVAEDAVVKFVDENGEEIKSASFTYDSKPHAMTAKAYDKQTGAELDSRNLKYTYLGIEGDAEGYYSTEAPSQAGVYTVVVTYLERNAANQVVKVGINVAPMIIRAYSDVEITVTDKVHVCDYTPVDIPSMIEVQVGDEAVGQPAVAIITAGINVHGDLTEDGWEVLESVVNIDFPEWADKLLAYVPSIQDGIDASDFISLIEGATETLVSLGIPEDSIRQILNVVDSLPEDIRLTFKDQNEIQLYEVGAYLVGGVVFDPNYRPVMDAGILVIVPDVQPVELKWNHDFPNGLVTTELLKEDAVFFNASAYLEGESEVHKTYTDMIRHVYLSVDADGFHVTTSHKDLKIGVATEVAVLVEIGDIMPAPAAILRPLIIAPQTVAVDVTGGTFQYDGQPKAASVTVDGEAMEPNEYLTVKYLGVNLADGGYNREAAPTEVGAYMVTATYAVYDDATGEILDFGMDVDTLVITPIDSEFAVNDTTMTTLDVAVLLEEGKEPLDEAIQNPNDMPYLALITKETEDGLHDVSILFPESWGIPSVSLPMQTVGLLVDVLKDYLPEEIRNDEAMMALVDQVIELAIDVLDGLELDMFSINAGKPQQDGVYQIYAFAYRDLHTMPVYDDGVLTIEYTNETPPEQEKETVATPVIIPAGGEYTKEQYLAGVEITISCDTPDAKIYYSINGNNPDNIFASGVKAYTGPFVIDKPRMVKAYAIKEDMNGALAEPAEFTLKGADPNPERKTAAPIFTPAAGTYTEIQFVEIHTETPGATIYYTTDGTEPGLSSAVYEGAIEVAENMTIRAYALAEGMLASDSAEASYVINLPGSVATPVFSPESGTYTGEQTVTISCETEGAEIWYIIDGETEQYVSPITVTENTIIEAYAKADGMVDSQSVEAEYLIRVHTPDFEVSDVEDSNSKLVTITCETEGATIYYTMDGSEPNQYSTVYPADGIIVDETVTIKAVAVKTNMVPSQTGEREITVEQTEEPIDPEVPKEQVKTPVIKATETERGAMISITCETDGATILYHTGDGAWKTYDGAFSIAETTTIYAKAVKEGMEDSIVVEKTVAIVEPDDPKPEDPDKPGQDDSKDEDFEFDFEYDVDLPFIDVDRDDWFYDDVRYVYFNDLMNGITGTEFGPDLDTTRGMIVTILWRLEGEPEVDGECRFRDVAPGQYYAEAIQWANENGIVLGYDAATFGPNDRITREQMAAILFRYSSFKGYDVSARADLSGYADADKISAYAVEAMSWANAEGLINGLPGDLLDPKGPAVRAQVAAILHRFCKKIVK